MTTREPVVDGSRVIDEVVEVVSESGPTLREVMAKLESIEEAVTDAKKKVIAPDPPVSVWRADDGQGGVFYTDSYSRLREWRTTLRARIDAFVALIEYDRVARERDTLRRDRDTERSVPGGIVFAEKAAPLFREGKRDKETDEEFLRRLHAAVFGYGAEDA